MPYYINKEGKQLFYEDIGKGQAFVWIHPPGMGRKVFRQQHVLADRYRMVFPDLSGNGDSQVVSKSPDISFYAREINELLDHLQLEQVILVGYSCGGMVAQEVALTYPERVKALILCGGFPKVVTGFLHFEFLAGMEWVQKSPATLARLLSHSHFRDENIKRELCEHMAKSDAEAWYAFYNRGLHFDCSRRLKELEMPLLLLYGNKEFWINHHTYFYRACKDVTLGIVEKAYHQIPATHAPAVHRMIERFVQDKAMV
ncbi:alpha/beta hydrolase [Halobacillus fulvus]|nr:alpha/beta hydrolase [Halobacillus fulvus]